MAEVVVGIVESGLVVDAVITSLVLAEEIERLEVHRPDDGLIQGRSGVCGLLDFFCKGSDDGYRQQGEQHNDR